MKHPLPTSGGVWRWDGKQLVQEIDDAGFAQPVEPAAVALPADVPLVDEKVSLFGRRNKAAANTTTED